MDRETAHWPHPLTTSMDLRGLGAAQTLQVPPGHFRPLSSRSDFTCPSSPLVQCRTYLRLKRGAGGVGSWAGSELELEGQELSNPSLLRVPES